MKIVYPLHTVTEYNTDRISFYLKNAHIDPFSKNTTRI